MSWAGIGYSMFNIKVIRGGMWYVRVTWAKVQGNLEPATLTQQSLNSYYLT